MTQENENIPIAESDMVSHQLMGIGLRAVMAAHAFLRSENPDFGSLEANAYAAAVEDGVGLALEEIGALAFAQGSPAPAQGGSDEQV